MADYDSEKAKAAARVRLAGSSSDPDVLSRLARDHRHEPGVAIMLSGNRATPAKVLVALARSGSTEALSNPSMPVAVMREMSEVPAIPTTKALTAATSVLRNPAAPGDLVERIGRQWPQVRDIAESRVTRDIHALGVAPANTEAFEMLRDLAWWTLDKDSPEVSLVLMIFPNP